MPSLWFLLLKFMCLLWNVIGWSSQVTWERYQPMRKDVTYVTSFSLAGTVLTWSEVTDWKRTLVPGHLVGPGIPLSYRYWFSFIWANMTDSQRRELQPLCVGGASLKSKQATFFFIDIKMTVFNSFLFHKGPALNTSMCHRHIPFSQL